MELRYILDNGTASIFKHLSRSLIGCWHYHKIDCCQGSLFNSNCLLLTSAIHLGRLWVSNPRSLPNTTLAHIISRMKEIHSLIFIFRTGSSLGTNPDTAPSLHSSHLLTLPHPPYSHRRSGKVAQLAASPASRIDSPAYYPPAPHP